MTRPPTEQNSGAKPWWLQASVRAHISFNLYVYVCVSFACSPWECCTLSWRSDVHKWTSQETNKQQMPPKLKQHLQHKNTRQLPSQLPPPTTSMGRLSGRARRSVRWQAQHPGIGQRKIPAPQKIRNSSHPCTAAAPVQALPKQPLQRGLWKETVSCHARSQAKQYWWVKFYVQANCKLMQPATEWCNVPLREELPEMHMHSHHSRNKCNPSSELSISSLIRA